MIVKAMCALPSPTLEALIPPCGPNAARNWGVFALALRLGSTCCSHRPRKEVFLRGGSGSAEEV